jgi:phosphate transport system substrate-binding protein
VFIRITTRKAIMLALAAALLCSCGPRQTGTTPSQPAGAMRAAGITIKGSDTMVHLVRAWIDGYIKTNPGAAISVTGGGSGTGVAALLNGTTDICASSRDLDDKEREAARTKGLELHEYIVARDAITLVVHSSNPLNELTLAQVRQIYLGRVTNWNEIGGPDLPITVLSRESSSGTFAFFVEHVLQKSDMGERVMLLAATSQIVQTVADSPGAIGYVGLGYAVEASDRLKILAIRAAPDAPPIMPSTATVLSGEYSVSRPLYLVVGHTPDGPVKSFIDYCLSADGQQIVERSGYVKVQ